MDRNKNKKFIITNSLRKNSKSLSRNFIKLPEDKDNTICS